MWKILYLTLLPLATMSVAQTFSIEAAGHLFQQAQDLSVRDGGRLWGKALSGPMLIVDLETRHAIANEPDATGILVRKGKLYEGTLPRLFGSRTSFGGHTWTVLMWPLSQMSEDPEPVILAHELWHHLQPLLGLDPEGIECPHLETMEGRISLRLEMRALRSALRAEGNNRRALVRQALALRADRQRRFPQGASAEARQEISEGLAEYTGFIVGLGPSKSKEYALDWLAAGDRLPHFTRCFAYRTGPAWCLMLDEAKPNWRENLQADSQLSDLLARALALDPKESLPAQMGDGLGATAVREEEEGREGAHQVHQAAIRKRFLESPVLRLPRLEGGVVAARTSELEAIEGGSTYEKALHAEFPWGVLEVTDGVVLSENAILVQAPAATTPNPIKGPGWTLVLKSGWFLVQSAESSDWTLAARN